VGTAITGRGADILIIDDPLKDREEAESEIRRETVWNWFTSTAYTRLEGLKAIIVIQTRWHEDDLTGRLLEAEAEGKDQYKKLTLPAINHRGEALWPERFPADELIRTRDNIGPRDWSALYQQEPSPEEGTFFKREWFKRHKMMPTDAALYLTSDYAVTEDDGDYTEHTLVGIAPDDMIYVSKDSWHGQTESDVWVEKKLDLIKAHRPNCAFGEAGVIQKAMAPIIKRQMIKRKVYCRIEWVPSIKDKATKARAIQARASMGMVSLPEGPEGDRMLDQLVAFPAGKHDDFVDTLGQLGRVLDEAHPGIAPRAPKKPKPKTGYQVPIRSGAKGWR
ncbi:MAG: terminase family protein, partial [Pseudomonadota bacterium]